MQAAMQMGYVPAACPFMKVINILSHDSELGYVPGQFGDSEMGSIWLRLQNLIPAPFIPSPTQ
ncbi:hypothetical protein BFN10_08760 [Pseudomonas extremorientalis]|uniref:Uncharacterized protein n=1 Tax=Pseudomonas extremorientalis TaxID=169669 RepID=A0A1S2TN29_9PSED|nr:hypothetical protein BFN10_08760 [Pseudomonas extremorientalis]